MLPWGFTYVAGDSPVHRCDARAKILLLLAFSLLIFFIDQWWQMALFGVTVVSGAAIARIPPRALVAPLVPVIVLALFAVLFAFVRDPTGHGLAAGAFIGVRMTVLVAASLVVCLASSPESLLGGFSKLIEPLRAVHVPVNDIALVLALSIRFIPVIAAELSRVRMAQKARGADLPTMGFWRSLGVWGAAFSAVFIGLFRHADALADAMDARCYGMGREGEDR